MDSLLAYLPQDRRASFITGHPLPAHTAGAALFADISGFTPITEALAQALGPRRGAEALTQQINAVYEALLEAVDIQAGSVVAFAGDAVTCWFDDGSAAGSGAGRAVVCARAMQQAMDAFAALPHPSGGTLALRLKVAIASGPAHRFLVGDPHIQLLDVLAGSTIDRMAAAELLAQATEIVVDQATIAALGAGNLAAWRSDPATGVCFAVLRKLKIEIEQLRNAPVSGLRDSQFSILNSQFLKPWLLPTVYNRLVAGQDELLTEIRPVVACFLRFGGLDYDIDSDAPAKLNDYICWVQQVVAAYEGVVIQLSLGDKGSYLYAAWGAPISHEDDDQRAVRAALELRVPPPALGFIGSVQIGLSRGEMRTGAYGSTTRRCYGALGDEVNLAARLMQVAAPGQILASGRVQAACANYFTWETLPPFQVKGKQVLVPAFLLHEARQTSIRLHEPRYHAPLIGRRKELEQITAALERAAMGAGQIIGVVGEAGLGKSRLLAEAVRTAQSAGWAVYGGAAQSFGTSSAYLAWRPIWWAFFGLSADEIEPVAHIQRELARLAPEATERMPLLESVLGLPLPTSELTAGMDEKLRKESREALLVELLQAQARQRPVLLVLEDCHWLDPLSEDLLDAIGRATVDLPVVVLLAYRIADLAHPPLPRVAALPNFTALALTSLAADEAAMFLALRLAAAHPGGGLAPVLIERLIERAQGNPFYLEELLVYLIDQGVDLTDMAVGARVELPVSLQSLILSRVDQLADRAQVTLKAASVLGRLIRVAWLALYQPALDSAQHLHSDLAELARLELIVLDTPAPDLAYLFKHIITYEVVYGSLAEEARVRLHGQVAVWLERAGCADLDLLAYHYSRSENAAKRREYLRRAGDAAAAAWSNAAAASYYQRLLAELAEDDAERSAVLRSLGDMLERQGDWEQAAARYSLALAAAANQQALAAAAYGLGAVRCKQGAYDQAAAWLEAAYSAFAAAGDQAGAGQSQIEIGRIHWLQGEYRQAREVLETSLRMAQDVHDKPAMAKVLYHLGILSVRQGELDSARALLEESLSLHEQQGSRSACASVLNSLGIVAMEKQEFEIARAQLEQSLALRRELGDRWGLALTLGNLGLMVQSQGDWQQAQSLHAESLNLSQNLGDRVSTANTLQNLGIGAIEQGELALAREQIAACLGLCRQLGPGAPTPAALIAAAAVIEVNDVAAQLLGAGMSLLATQGSVLEALEQRVYDQAKATIHASLGPASFGSALAEGHALPWEHAIDTAVATLAL
jgi:predicted ATPase/class 3 adenylate cyclase